MNSLNFLRTIQPFIAVIAVIATASMLVVAIYFTLLDLAWIAFLTGILFAGLIAVVTSATRAEFAAASSGARLAVLEDEVVQTGKRAEKMQALLARADAKLQFADEKQPAMVAYIDDQGIYRYHNRAFGRLLDLPASRIDGHHMREALGRLVYAQIEPDVARALGGETVRYLRTHKMSDGASVRLNVQLLPVLGTRGEPVGFFGITSDASEGPRARGGDAFAQSAAAIPESPAARVAREDQEHFNASVAEQATGMPDARARILAAIKRNEFLLYCQRIVPLDPASGGTTHYEILIRLQEEESNMISPGAFFPLAEETGLLPALDRWVVADLLARMASRGNGDNTGQKEIFFINIATATLCDADFPDYVAHQLNKHNCPAGMLCFEIAASDLSSNRGDVDEFVRLIKLAGCRVALSGFGRHRVGINVLKDLPLDFLKIDGSVILQLHSDPVNLCKVVAICRIANTIGITTIAEMVEDGVTVAKLRKTGIPYGQGFGVSPPQPLSELTGRSLP